MSAAIAAYTPLKTFHTMSVQSEQLAKSLSHLISRESQNFSGSALKKLSSDPKSNRFIRLGTGRPNAEFYPWSSISFELHSTSSGTRSSSTTSSTPGFRTDPFEESNKGSYTLEQSLNYGNAAGSAELVQFLTDHVRIVHNPPYRDWSTCLGSGTTSALEIALRIFCDRGHTILTEGYTYPGMIECAQLMGVNTLGIDIDSQGLVPDCLEQALSMWDESRGARPHLLYTIPSGQNPTGTTQPLERKEAIYDIAERYDLVILEDDPYFFLQMQSRRSTVDYSHNVKYSNNFDATQFLTDLSRSYLSLDRSGRVIRLDSTSKILAPGLRVGWITASAQIIDRFLAYHDISTVSVSGPTQMMLWDLLIARWGHGGFFSWLEHLSLRYMNRLNILIDACVKYMPEHVCQWTPPQNGMFLWISIDLLHHPSFQNVDGRSPGESELSIQVEKSIFDRAMNNGVQVTRGSLFDTTTGAAHATHVIHFRITYAAADESELDEGVLKFANAVRDEFGLELVG